MECYYNLMGKPNSKPSASTTFVDVYGGKLCRVNQDERSMCTYERWYEPRQHSLVRSDEFTRDVNEIDKPHIRQTECRKIERERERQRKGGEIEGEKESQRVREPIQIRTVFISILD